MEHVVPFVALGLWVVRHKGSLGMHRAKTINEVVHLLQLQLIERVPQHGLQDLAGAHRIDVGVVRA